MQPMSENAWLEKSTAQRKWQSEELRTASDWACLSCWKADLSMQTASTKTTWDYSKFCTCSRNCSIATFISTEMLVSSSDEALEPMVLASRSSS
jgi:hypothetical protein